MLIVIADNIDGDNEARLQEQIADKRCILLNGGTEFENAVGLITKLTTYKDEYSEIIVKSLGSPNGRVFDEILKHGIKVIAVCDATGKVLLTMNDDRTMQLNENVKMYKKLRDLDL